MGLAHRRAGGSPCNPHRSPHRLMPRLRRPHGRDWTCAARANAAKRGSALRHVMTNCLKLNPFDPIARGATPMPSVGSSSYAHKTRRTARSRLSVVDELKIHHRRGHRLLPPPTTACGSRKPRREHRMSFRFRRVDRAPITALPQDAASFNPASNRSRAGPVAGSVTRDLFEASGISDMMSPGSDARGRGRTSAPL
jgi:hypothetical protein